ncbi:MAG: SET domain-containing protein-lysine N-methyltransferase [archaeon]
MKNSFFLEKKVSSINGFGIFTNIPIKQEQIFYVIPLEKVVNVPTSRFAYIGNNKYVNDEEVLNWINHSCEPNTVLDISTQEPYLRSVRDISSGEEITCDYNQTEIDGVEILCNCKSEKCRGKFMRIE